MLVWMDGWMDGCMHACCAFRALCSKVRTHACATCVLPTCHNVQVLLDGTWQQAKGLNKRLPAAVHGASLRRIGLSPQIVSQVPAVLPAPRAVAAQHCRRCALASVNVPQLRALTPSPPRPCAPPCRHWTTHAPARCASMQCRAGCAPSQRLWCFWSSWRSYAMDRCWLGVVSCRKRWRGCWGRWKPSARLCTKIGRDFFGRPESGYTMFLFAACIKRSHALESRE